MARPVCRGYSVPGDRRQPGRARLRGYRASGRCLAIPGRGQLYKRSRLRRSRRHAASGERGSGSTAALGWVAQAEGAGTQTLRWTVRGGDWMVVVMNPDGSPGVTVRVDVGVSSPALPWLAGELWPPASWRACSRPSSSSSPYAWPRAPGSAMAWLMGAGGRRGVPDRFRGAAEAEPRDHPVVAHGRVSPHAR